MGARSFPGNPYDGHTMHEQIEQSAFLMQGMGVKPEVVYADLGYRGVDKENLGIEIKHRGKDERLTNEDRRLLKRRQAIVPIMGHLKVDHRMDRCYLKGSKGDALPKSWLQQAQRRPQAPRPLPKTIAKLIFTLGSAVEGILLR